MFRYIWFFTAIKEPLLYEEYWFWSVCANNITNVLVAFILYKPMFLFGSKLWCSNLALKEFNSEDTRATTKVDKIWYKTRRVWEFKISCARFLNQWSLWKQNDFWKLWSINLKSSQNECSDNFKISLEALLLKPA